MDRKNFYKSVEWRKIRKVVLNREPICRHCLKEGKITVANTVDHINHKWETWEDFLKGPFQPLCGKHHNLKTASETAEAQAIMQRE